MKIVVPQKVTKVLDASGVKAADFEKMAQNAIADVCTGCHLK